MKYCIKYDKFYATQEEYDSHFARWKERSKYVEEYNRGLAPGEAKLVLTAQADLSDEEVAAAASGRARARRGRGHQTGPDRRPVGE